MLSVSFSFNWTDLQRRERKKACEKKRTHGDREKNHTSKSKVSQPLSSLVSFSPPPIRICKVSEEEREEKLICIYDRNTTTTRTTNYQPQEGKLRMKEKAKKRKDKKKNNIGVTV